MPEIKIIKTGDEKHIIELNSIKVSDNVVSDYDDRETIIMTFDKY